MNADQLLAHYEQVADAPDAFPRLRRFILDLAVRGKLVEQNLADEPASELLKRIAAEKARLVKTGKFKSLGVGLPRDDASFPYSIPANWVWCYLDDLAAIARGGSPRPIKSYLTDDPNGIPWIKIGDSVRGSVYINSTKERIRPEGLAKSRLVFPGDLLLSNSMSFGYPYITNVEGCIHDGWLVIRTPEELFDKLYLHKVFLSDHAKSAFSEAASGAVVQNLNADKARLLSVPLPPLAEQHRIVAKVDELMALCDRLEAVRAEREATRDRLAAASLARLNSPDSDPAVFQSHAAFALDNLAPLTTRPDQIKALRQFILNLAVRGKLVPQDPNDEPASELLKRIRYFEVHGLAPDWPAFLDDFQRHWPTDEDHTYVDFVRDGSVGNGAARMGTARWRRLTEERAGRAKSVFHFDVQGQVAKSTHAGIPWLGFIRQRLGDQVHFWPFDGWDVPEGRSTFAEVYPALWSRNFAREGRTPDQHDAWSIADRLFRADRDGSLAGFLKPDLTPPERTVAQVEGWILGVE